MDFLLGKDLSTKQALELVSELMVLSVEDKLSRVAIEIPLEKKWLLS